ncbi:hypothetical protein ACH4KU_33605 [Streptomyces althioticus]|uniref:hypothetical protein n=1 Tax=Streptomyces althioticus TaxID=83380 RepID=UPI0037AA3E39
MTIVQVGEAEELIVGGVVVAFVAGMTTLCKGMPRMTTARCRLQPLIFFPAV